ncbi:Protein YIPF1 [Grifola frondosa]|uniref:Protein YIP n=1 Tax=Grifola frondosa TaxID=5627 RepID=A0A1C7MJJ2_GRIFR|nr:Protein YIPF1 [Grifola frondosa]
MEEGPDGLQFQSFLGTDARATNQGYIPDGGPSRNSGFWTLEYYQPYFDVDTKLVLRRCYTTFLPFSRSYISAHLTPSVDLYGPFWTLTTLIFSLFVFSSLASSIAAYLSHPGDSSPAVIEYDFGLLSTAVALVYSYGLGVPVLLWLGLRYLGVGEWSVVEAVSVWGYAQFVWIPVALLCVIPVPLVRWILVGIAFIVSGWFLAANVYPVLASADAKPVRLIIILLAALHVGLALCLKILFFSYYAVKEIGVPDPIS